jgi:AraC family carnitine catabolism transcriptional activator
MSKNRPHTVHFLLFPRFQLLGYVLAIETLRIANKVAGEKRFAWKTLSVGSAPVAASNGVEIEPDCKLADANKDCLLMVCAGYEPLQGLESEASKLLRNHALRGRLLGGIDTGAVILAELGLLNGYRAVLHWEAEAGFRENYPDIPIDDTLYVFDRTRLTTSGGTATGDAILAWIASVESSHLALQTADDMVHGRIREADEKQLDSHSMHGNSLLSAPRNALAVHPDTILSRTIERMKHNLEEPLSIQYLESKEAVGKRRLLQLFRNYFNRTPSSYYMGLRLLHARSLLASTSLPAASIGNACGFTSPAWFCRAYVKRFGISPIQHRKILLSPQGAGHFD